MSIHSDNFAASCDALFEQLGESDWTYTPHGGAARAIDVITTAGEMTESPMQPGQRLARTVKTRIGGTCGIDPATLNTGADRLSGPEYPGGAARNWQIVDRPVARGGLLVMRVK